MDEIGEYIKKYKKSWEDLPLFKGIEFCKCMLIDDIRTEQFWKLNKSLGRLLSLSTIVPRDSWMKKKIPINNSISVKTGGASNLCGKNCSLYTILKKCLPLPHLQILRSVCQFLHLCSSKARIKLQELSWDVRTTPICKHWSTTTTRHSWILYNYTGTQTSGLYRDHTTISLRISASWIRISIQKTSSFV